MPGALTSNMRRSAHMADLDSPRAGSPPPEPTSAAHTRATMENFVCEACGDSIGVYEPLVMRTSESERTTSRAAEPHLQARDGAYFHRECRDGATG
jgi:hypothetical protein